MQHIYQVSTQYIIMQPVRGSWRAFKTKGKCVQFNIKQKEPYKINILHDSSCV